MRDFDSLREDFARAFEAIEHQLDATTRLLLDHGRAIARTWDDLEALRGEVNEQVTALSNRVESLTRARL